eukprot:CAMPEP_0201728598 /NCGR_PEP_ID=MMETSP0593-20130828/16455_1 /ASSEMBLY_ACC=CAM_ASM_000672 /TAXON_ID=267983 /ORGANISM="Skeletonema japonicum, Strain CCMP2506" /LENGTH=327 /DNA_ID=CAMNT_0048220757 /DNA_START=146 /DNA_END=1129 /DNA_ORIENTATION=-
MEAFDPFNVSDADDLFTATVTPKSEPDAPVKTRLPSFNIKPQYVAKDKAPPVHVLPKMDVKFKLFEEVTSKAVLGMGEDGTVELFVEGKVMAQAESSISRIPPFSLQITSPPLNECDIVFQNFCKVQSERKIQVSKQRSIKCKVDIPQQKAECEMLRYSITVETKNMPLLVQSKATLKEKNCRVGIQIRSNLSNQGDINDLSISIPIPNTMQESTVKITRGADTGSWDECKRMVTWKIGTLAHGQSVLVSVEAEISHTMAQLLADDDLSSAKFNEKINCPVLVRCSSSSDTLTDFALSASPWMEDPSNLSLQQDQSYRLLHRVPTRK